ncbi:MAG: hypothetical protein ACI4TK_05130 [Agathobacter sp.]
MFTWIDMLLMAIVAAAVTAFIILFLLGSTLQEREGQEYQEGYSKGIGNRTEPRTNGDKIRALTDEELAEKILRIDLGEAPYCGTDNARCIEMVDSEELGTSTMCLKCCIKWLQQEER